MRRPDAARLRAFAGATLFGLLLAPPAADLATATDTDATPLAIDDVTVVDVAGGRLLAHRDVRVAGEWIVAVAAAAPPRRRGATTAPATSMAVVDT